ncbi:MAG: PAS domain S-box protein [candidate division Zixibacteria bacterium]|nr:PAS domain S-box protein [candidate division Zixibacteria bacterium]
MAVFTNFNEFGDDLGLYLQYVAEKCPLGIYGIRDSIIIFANKKFADILGISLEAISNSPLETLFSTAIHQDFSKSAKCFYMSNTKPENRNSNIELRLKDQSLGEHWIKLHTQIISGKDKPLLFGLIEDISQGKQTEKELKISEEHYRYIFNDSNDAIFVTKRDSSFYDVNKATEELTGFSKDELLKMRIPDLHYPEDLRAYDDFFDKIVAGEEVIAYADLKRKNGSRVPVEFSNKRVIIREVSYMLTVARDITVHKADQQVLRESEERYRQSVENSPNPIFSLNSKGIILAWNKACEYEFGYSSEIIGQSYKILMPDGETGNGIDSELARGFRKEYLNDIDITFQCRDGSIRFMLSRMYPLLYNCGEVQACVLANTDITDRKKAEQALQESELFNRAVIEKSPFGVSVRNKTGKLLKYNSAWQNIWNKSDEDIREDIERERLELKFDGNDSYLGKWQAEIRNIYNNGGYLHIPEARVVGHRGRVGNWVAQHFYAISDKNGEVDKVVILTEDITERKTAELALQESELFNRAVIEKSPLGVSVRDSNGRLLSCNRAWQDIWGKSDEDVRLNIATDRSELKFDKRDDYLKNWHYEVRRIYEKGGYLHIPETKTLFRRMGEERWVSQHFYAISNNDGTVDKVVILTEDITERRRVELSLEESEARFREITEMAPAGIFEMDMRLKLTFINRRAYEHTGYTPEDFKEGIFALDIIHPKDQSKAKENIKRVMADGPLGMNEYRAVRKDGSEFDASVFTNPIHDNGKVVGFRGIILDISERKRAEDALKQSEMKYRVLVENAGQPIFSISREGVFLMMNSTASAYLGGHPDDFIGKSLYDLFPMEIAEQQLKNIRQSIDSGKKIINENKATIQGRTIWYTISIQPVVDADETHTYALLIANDITQRKRLEIREKSKSWLLDRLREAKDINECLELGCRTILDGMLYKNSTIFIYDENEQISYFGQSGFTEPMVWRRLSKYSPVFDSKPNTNDHYLTINHSCMMFIGPNKSAPTGTDCLEEKKSFAEDTSDWQDGNLFFVPLMDSDNKAEGWLVVDSPFSGKRPSEDDAIFLEELVDIVVKKVHEIQHLKLLKSERLALEKKNITLREVLAHIEQEKMDIKNQVANEIEKTLMPIMKKLVDADGNINNTYYNILDNGLKSLASSPGSRHIYSKLSPREIEISSLIKEGTNSKDIALALNISLATVQKHRESIRRKLGITNKSVNLMTFLKG